jgi:CheY-like chemotaxis protein
MSRTVLLVEDERKTRVMLTALLEELGYTVTCATTAHEAIRLAVSERPEVIVIDGLLPQMHGFEVARFIRASDPAYRPQVIFMSAIYRNVRYQNEARLKYGIDQYLIKPVTAGSMAAALASLSAPALAGEAA